LKRKIRIALSGKAGCGKTTIAKNLVKDWGFRRFSFAKKLKEVYYDLFPESKGKRKEEIREDLKWLGCTLRIRKPDIWIQVVLREIEKLKPERVVIDDLRFVNEAQILRRAKFNLIRIERAETLRQMWGYNVRDEHPSECDLDDYTRWDRVVINNGKYPFLEATNVILQFLRLKI